MTTENQNQEMELDDLKVQYQSLQEKFNQQEIVNNDLIHEMIQTKIGNFKRRNVVIICTYVLLISSVSWSWACFQLQLTFRIMSVLLFLFIGLFELLSSRRVLKINTEDADIQTLIQKMKNFRIRFSLVWIIGVLAMCLWMMWYVAEVDANRQMVYLQPSFAIVAFSLVISIMLIIGSIDRLSKMSDELLSLTSQLNGSETEETTTYRRGEAYWTGVVLLVLSLMGLVFKLMHWPFANLIFLVACASGLVFVFLASRHLVRVVPEERPVIRIAEVACLFLVVDAACKMFHWPLPKHNILALTCLSLLLAAAFVYWLRQRRGERQ